MTTVVDRWRAEHRELRLSDRLRAWDFPCTLREALDSAQTRQPAMQDWARRGLREGWLLRNAPIEMIARGLSLEEAAYWCIGGPRGTRDALLQTLQHLMRAPWESEEDAGDA